MLNIFKKIDVSIIIVSYNTKNLLLKCIKSLIEKEKTSPYSYEIIVVDNASSDESVKAVKTKYPKITVIENKKNLGFAKANNQAIKIARGKYILLLNSDTVIIEFNCFSKMIRFMEKNPEVGILGCTLIFPNGLLQSVGEKFPYPWEIFKSQILFSKFWRRLTIFKKINRNKRKDNFQEADWVTGACLLTKKGIINNIGLLKENYFMYGEDVEFCYRVHKFGWKIGVLKNVKVIHLRGKSTKKNLSEILYQSTKNDIKNTKIIYGKRQALLVKIFHFIGLLLRSCLSIFRKKRYNDYLKCAKKLIQYKN